MASVFLTHRGTLGIQWDARALSEFLGHLPCGVLGTAVLLSTTVRRRGQKQQQRDVHSVPALATCQAVPRTRRVVTWSSYGIGRVTVPTAQMRKQAQGEGAYRPVASDSAFKAGTASWGAWQVIGGMLAVQPASQKRAFTNLVACGVFPVLGSAGFVQQTGLRARCGGTALPVSPVTGSRPVFWPCGPLAPTRPAAGKFLSLGEFLALCTTDASGRRRRLFSLWPVAPSVSLAASPSAPPGAPSPWWLVVVVPVRGPGVVRGLRPHCC